MKLWLLAVCLLVASAAAAQEFAVTPADFLPATNASAPRIAASADRYFVSWIAGGTLYGTRLDANGNVLDTPPLLLTPSASDTYAVIGTGNGDFLVVGYAAGAFVATRVTRDGVRGNVATIFPAMSDRPLALATNGATVLAALTDRVALLDFDGNRIAGPNALDGFDGLMTAASDGTDYLVAGRNRLGDVVATPVDGRGRVGAQSFVAVTAATTGIALASDGSRYLVASVADVLRTQFLGTDGEPLGPWQNTALPLDATGTRLTWDGSGYVAAFGMSRAFGALRIGADGKAAGDIAEAPVPHPFNQSNRFDLAGSMLVFENANTIWRASLTNGAFGPATVVSLAAPEQTLPSIASMPDGAVVAWAEGSPRLARLGTDGRPSGRVVTLQGSTTPVTSTRVAFDGTNVVVAFTFGTSLYAQRFTAALDPVDPAPLLLGSGPGVIAGGRGVTLLAWTEPQKFGYSRMNGVLLRGSDWALPLQFPVPLAEPVDPAAVWEGSDFLVMWGEQRDVDTAAGVRFASNGLLLNAAPLKLVLHSESSSVSRLALASNGRDVYAVWTNHDFDTPSVVFGKRIGAAGAQALFTTSTLGTPMVAALHSGFVAGALNVDLAQENLKWVNGGPLQSLAFTPVVRDNVLPLGAFAQSGNNVLAAYTRWDPAAGYVHRVFVRVIATEKPHAVRR